MTAAEPPVWSALKGHDSKGHFRPLPFHATNPRRADRCTAMKSSRLKARSQAETVARTPCASVMLLAQACTFLMGSPIRRLDDLQIVRDFEQSATAMRTAWQVVALTRQRAIQFHDPG